MGKTKTVGKDREGNYHPPKGKPSGIDKEEGLGLQATDPEKLDQYLEVTDKYTEGEDHLAEHVKVRHPNRNVNKRNDALRENSSGYKQQSEETDKSNNESFAEPVTKTTAIELPPVLSKEILAQLNDIKSERCISIYLPTHAAGVEVNEGHDAIRFKNLLQQATQQLQTFGYNEGQIKNWLKPAFDLHRDDNFWKRQSKGLALFVGDDFCSYIHLQQPPSEKVYINKGFSLGPLVKQLIRSEYFYLLTVSKKQAKLYRADDYGLYPVPVENMPINSDQAPAENKGLLMADVADSGSNATTSDSAQYFKQVNDAIKAAVLHKEHVPLLLAGVESTLVVYRSVNDYPYLWAEMLTGNHEREETDKLYQQARAMMQPWFEERERKALHQYRNQSATTLTSVNLAEIIPAAHYGRIAHLFVAGMEPVWGTFNEETNELTIQGESTGFNEDLLDLAVTNTLLRGGEVHMLDRRKMPERSDMAAIFRYEQS